MKTLQIIETAYRATLEEQDDTVIWLTRSINNAGGELDVLLRGNAVNYCVEAQDSSGFSVGGWRQKNPPRPAADMAALVAQGARVWVVTDDLDHRGIARQELIAGVEPVAQAALADILRRYDRIWHW